MWTMDNTDGFTQDQLDEINEIRAKLMDAHRDSDAWLRLQLAKSIDDAINNAWGVEDLEAAVRKSLGM